MSAHRRRNPKTRKLVQRGSKDVVRTIGVQFNMLLDRRSGFRRFTAPANPSPKEATDMGEIRLRSRHVRPRCASGVHGGEWVATGATGAPNVPKPPMGPRPEVRIGLLQRGAGSQTALQTSVWRPSRARLFPLSSACGLYPCGRRSQFIFFLAYRLEPLEQSPVVSSTVRASQG